VYGFQTGHGRNGEMSSASGRWPANVVLSHDSRCEQVGTRRVKPIGATAHKSHHGKDDALIRNGRNDHPGFRDADGLETVEAWRCVDSCPVRLLDEQSGDLGKSSGGNSRAMDVGSGRYNWNRGDRQDESDGVNPGFGDSGGASRFFYTAKSSSAERNAGLEGFEERPSYMVENGSRTSGLKGERYERHTVTRNSHPTVKPIALMRWLVRLVTPPGGTVLDCFAGSGTTGIAASLEGFNFVGIEREEEYVRIAEARIKWWQQHPEGMEITKSLEADRKRRAVADSGQLGFLD
jgi:hypothetical protein